jgi:hypothetical protein
MKICDKLKFRRYNEMNNTKWNEIFNAFYKYECNSLPVIIRWRTKDNINGFLSKWDSTWTHFGCEPRKWETIDYLQIELTNDNRNLVIEHLKRIHVPGVISDNVLTVYGYRQDVEYI